MHKNFCNKTGVFVFLHIYTYKKLYTTLYDQICSSRNNIMVPFSISIAVSLKIPHDLIMVSERFLDIDNSAASLFDLIGLHSSQPVFSFLAVSAYLHDFGSWESCTSS